MFGSLTREHRCRPSRIKHRCRPFQLSPRRSNPPSSALPQPLESSVSFESPVSSYADRYIGKDMPPPEVVTNALKHLLGEVPSLKAELFEPAYPSVKQELKYGGSGRSILLLMLGMSYSKPHMMGYQIDLSGVEGVQPDYDAFDTYHVWLTDVSSDLERNRQAFTLALRSLIEQEGTTILMRTWNVPTMLPA